MTEAEKLEAKTELAKLQEQARQIETKIAEAEKPATATQPANMAELAQRFPVLNRR